MDLSALPTAAVADACVRLGVKGHAASLKPVIAGRTVAGPALPVRHAGSVDAFFEAFQSARPGSVLVVDNQGRLDEGCVGDLTALEAMHHGITAMAIDGCHRDTAALQRLGLPVWSRMAFPFGPREARPRAKDAFSAATFAGFEVWPGDAVCLDDDGAVFVPAADAPRVWALANKIFDVESEQARLAQDGKPLCVQFDVAGYLHERKADPQSGFRAHLRRLGNAIEE